LRRYCASLAPGICNSYLPEYTLAFRGKAVETLTGVCRGVCGEERPGYLRSYIAVHANVRSIETAVGGFMKAAKLLLAAVLAGGFRASAFVQRSVANPGELGFALDRLKQITKASKAGSRVPL
jgi:hypothetical protein